MKTAGIRFITAISRLTYIVTQQGSSVDPVAHIVFMPGRYCRMFGFGFDAIRYTIGKQFAVATIAREAQKGVRNRLLTIWIESGIVV